MHCTIIQPRFIQHISKHTIICKICDSTSGRYEHRYSVLQIEAILYSENWYLRRTAEDQFVMTALFCVHVTSLFVAQFVLYRYCIKEFYKTLFLCSCTRALCTTKCGSFPEDGIVINVVKTPTFVMLKLIDLRSL